MQKTRTEELKRERAVPVLPFGGADPYGGSIATSRVTGSRLCAYTVIFLLPTPAPWERDESSLVLHFTFLTCAAPRHPLISELNRLICIKKKKEREKEQERLSSALHKNDELLLDIGQERKRVLFYLVILVS